MVHTLDGREITHENLHLFYSILDDLNRIPYCGVKETNNFILWEWSYNGGWGLGYDGILKYNQLDGRYYLTCHKDNTIFNDDKFNHKVNQTIDGYKIEYDNNEVIKVSTSDLSKVIEVGYYYGFGLKENSDISSTLDNLEKSKKKILEFDSYLCKY